MTRINDHLVVQYIDGDGPADDRIVIVDDPSGTEIVIDFSEATWLHDALAYFISQHLARQMQRIKP